jgi:hypothetical protein
MSEETTMANNADTPTISIDQSSFDYWRGTVDAVLKDIAAKMDKMNETLVILNEWRSDIRSRVDLADQRLSQHDQMLAEQGQSISGLAEATQKVIGMVDQISKSMTVPQPDDTKNIEDKAPTFKWITEKFWLPILIAAIGFFLFTVMPAIFVLVYILPKLMEQAGP